MANICCDTVVFYLEDGADISSLHKFVNDLKTCYPELTEASDDWIGILFEHLHLPTENLHLRGSIIHMEIQDAYIRLNVDAAWRPLFHAYQALADYYGLQFVFQAEEAGASIFVNTDAYGLFLDTRYRILLYLENDASGTPYEKLCKAQTDTDFYFSSEKEMLSWLSEYGIFADSAEELEEKLDEDFMQLNVYDLTYE